MYLAVDIGGTKTLLAVFNDNGAKIEEFKFPTPQNYEDFLAELENNIKNLKTDDFQAACIAVPGALDRDKGLALSYGNLYWKPEPIEEDVERIVECPTIIENDAKLAGLYQAVLLKKDYRKVLYITIGTGIGVALVNKGVIDDAVGDSGGHEMYVEFGGKRTTWEKLASGKAIKEKYGKMASEIDSTEVWKEISERISIGLVDLIAIFQPEVIVIGGGVGAHFKKFETFIEEYLHSYESPMMPIPPLLQAQKPEESVVYGCLELIKEKYGSTYLKTA